MAKKAIKPEVKVNEVEVVFSTKYDCYITKKDAYFDEVSNSWINEGIEKVWRKHSEPSQNVLDKF